MNAARTTASSTTFARPNLTVHSKSRRHVATPATKSESDAIVKAANEKRNYTNVYMASEQSLSYLDGTLQGDYGFDPLGIYDPEATGGVITQEWLRYAELIHARFAMLGAAGCLAPEMLGKIGVIPAEHGIVWWKAGFIGPTSAGYEYWSDYYTVFLVQVILMQFAELRRLQDFKKPGSMGNQYFLGLESSFKGSGDPCYPGGTIFNFAGFGKTEKSLNDLKLKEIKNGRLAMLSMFGYGAQAIMTGKSPVENFMDHLADPVHNNILTNFGHIYGQT